MTDRPINPTDWQVRAALDGRLSLVVEPIKDAPAGLHMDRVGPTGWQWTGTHGLPRIPFTPKRAIGDCLWVREAWKTDRCYDDLAPSEMGGEEPLIYICDDTVQRWGWKPDALSKWGRIRRHQHMPRWASRLTLIVTDVKVMRVQEIGEGQAAATGLFKPYDIPLRELVDSPFRTSFQRAWNARHAKRGLGWDENPWVTATTVTVHRCNIDQMEADHD